MLPAARYGARRDRTDLLADEAEMGNFPLQLGQCVGWDGTSLRRTQVRQLLRCFAQFGVEAPDAEAHQRGFHAVDDAGTLADQLLALGPAACRKLTAAQTGAARRRASFAAAGSHTVTPLTIWALGHFAIAAR